MAVQLVDSNIVFGNTTVARQSVGVMLFASRHNYFKERVKSFSSTSDLINSGIPSTSNIYKALSGAFAQSPAPSFIKVARLESDSIITPVDAVEGKEYKLSIQVDTLTAPVDFSHTAAATPTKEVICTALKALIDANADVNAIVTTTVVGTDDAATLVLSHTTSNTSFVVSSLVNVTESFPATPTQSAADQLAAITLEDDDFYWFMSDVKTSAYVQALAADMATRFGAYVVSLAEADAYSTTLTGTFKTLLVDNQYDNVYALYHHEAETTFPEVAHIAEAAPNLDQGITFANRQTEGVAASTQVDGVGLSTTHTQNLLTNEVPFFAKVKTVGSSRVQATNPTITVGGKVANGELISNIVGRDSLRIDLETGLTSLLLSQKAGRLSWDRDSLAKVYNVVDRVLKKYADKDGWNLIFGADSDFSYKISLPSPAEIDPLDKADNILRQCSFECYLKGAIHMIKITGTLA